MPENEEVAGGGFRPRDVPRLAAVAAVALAMVGAGTAVALREPGWERHTTSTVVVASTCPLPGDTCAGRGKTVRIDLGCGGAGPDQVPSTSDAEGR